MTTNLTVLRRQGESGRFPRERLDDSRTGIAGKTTHSLEKALERAIEGEVRFDKGTRALYATDGSNYRQAPIGVVLPRHGQDVETTVRRASTAYPSFRGAGVRASPASAATSQW